MCLMLNGECDVVTRPMAVVRRRDACGTAMLRGAGALARAQVNLKLPAHGPVAAIRYWMALRSASQRVQGSGSRTFLWFAILI